MSLISILGICVFGALQRPASSQTRMRSLIPATQFILTISRYNLFSTNVILASVAFVYWPHGRNWPGLLINIFTLIGSVVGQLLFGFLADYYGRTKLYGIELVLVIVSTIGVATSSHGYGDLNFLGLFIWWRFVMGIGTLSAFSLRSI